MQGLIGPHPADAIGTRIGLSSPGAAPSGRPSDEQLTHLDTIAQALTGASWDAVNGFTAGTDTTGIAHQATEAHQVGMAHQYVQPGGHASAASSPQLGASYGGTTFLKGAPSMSGGGVTIFGGRPVTPGAPHSGQNGAVSYLGGHTPVAQNGGVTFFGAAPYTPGTPHNGQMGAVTYLGGARPVAQKGGVTWFNMDIGAPTWQTDQFVLVGGTDAMMDPSKMGRGVTGGDVNSLQDGSLLVDGHGNQWIKMTQDDGTTGLQAIAGTEGDKGTFRTFGRQPGDTSPMPAGFSQLLNDQGDALGVGMHTPTPGSHQTPDSMGLQLSWDNQETPHQEYIRHLIEQAGFMHAVVHTANLKGSADAPTDSPSNDSPSSSDGATPAGHPAIGPAPAGTYVEYTDSSGQRRRITEADLQKEIAARQAAGPSVSTTDPLTGKTTTINWADVKKSENGPVFVEMTDPATGQTRRITEDDLKGTPDPSSDDSPSSSPPTPPPAGPSPQPAPTAPKAAGPAGTPSPGGPKLGDKNEAGGDTFSRDPVTAKPEPKRNGEAPVGEKYWNDPASHPAPLTSDDDAGNQMKDLQKGMAVVGRDRDVVARVRAGRPAPKPAPKPLLPVYQPADTGRYGKLLADKQGDIEKFKKILEDDAGSLIYKLGISKVGVNTDKAALQNLQDDLDKLQTLALLVGPENAYTIFEQQRQQEWDQVAKVFLGYMQALTLNVSGADAAKSGAETIAGLTAAHGLTSGAPTPGMGTPGGARAALGVPPAGSSGVGAVGDVPGATPGVNSGSVPSRVEPGDPSRGILFSATRAPETAPAPQQQGTAECGPTCLANAQNNNGINASKGEVVALAANSGNFNGRGQTYEQAFNTADLLGMNPELETFTSPGDMEQSLANGNQMMVAIETSGNTNHWVLVEKISSDGTLTINDAGRGERYQQSFNDFYQQTLGGSTISKFSSDPEYTQTTDPLGIQKTQRDLGILNANTSADTGMGSRARDPFGYGIVLKAPGQ